MKTFLVAVGAIALAVSVIWALTHENMSLGPIPANQEVVRARKAFLGVERPEFPGGRVASLVRAARSSEARERLGMFDRAVTSLLFEKEPRFQWEEFAAACYENDSRESMFQPPQFLEGEIQDNRVCVRAFLRIHPHFDESTQKIGESQRTQLFQGIVSIVDIGKQIKKDLALLEASVDVESDAEFFRIESEFHSKDVLTKIAFEFKCECDIRPSAALKYGFFRKNFERDCFGARGNPALVRELREEFAFGMCGAGIPGCVTETALQKLDDNQLEQLCVLLAFHCKD